MIFGAYSLNRLGRELDYAKSGRRRRSWGLDDDELSSEEGDAVRLDRLFDRSSLLLCTVRGLLGGLVFGVCGAGRFSLVFDRRLGALPAS